MIPTADDVARAIVAASKETGADPIAVAKGENDNLRGRHVDGARPYPISRARAYAAKALAAVFTACWRTRIAGMVGTRGLSRQSYFSALDQRIKDPAGPAWWDVAILGRVIEAIEQNHDLLKRRMEIEKAKAPEYRAAPPEYRPPAGTAARVLADDDDEGPIFDVGGVAAVGFKRREAARRGMSKAEMEADLRAAVERTAAQQKQED